MTAFLLTGGGGFVGQWIARRLLERGESVVLAGVSSPESGPRILDERERAAVRWIRTDLRDASDAANLIEAARPDVIIHLAAVAFPPAADRDPAAAYDVNTLGIVRLLGPVVERRRAGTLDPVVVVIGSAYQYGAHDAADMPLAETAEQRPSTPYSASKAAQEIAALQFFRADGLRVICARPFNHSGPGHAPHYLLPSLVRRILDVGARGAGVVTVGNETIRDYLHVRDVADAYLALAERGRPGEAYNVASGRGLSVRELAADVLLQAGVHADISTEPALVRSVDLPVLVGSAAKLRQDTGWAPRLTHADIIDDLLRSAHAATD